MIHQASLKSLAKMIDHSLLHPTLTDEAILEGCELAKKYDVATVCVKPYAIQLARKVLAGSGVEVSTVAGFPHGNSTIDIKLNEARESIFSGACEIDMVVNIGKVLSEDWEYASKEIEKINRAVVSQKAILKVIFENDFLEDRHIIKLCELCTTHSVAFVKTSTGYGFVKQANGLYSYQGATDHQLQIMRKHCPPSIQVKAAGGVRTLDDLLRVRALGVTRIGATATEEILEEAKRKGFR